MILKLIDLDLRISQFRRLMNRDKIEVIFFLFGIIQLKKRRILRKIKNILGDKEDLVKLNQKYPKIIKKQSCYLIKNSQIRDLGEEIVLTGIVPIFGNMVNIGWPPKFETEETAEWPKSKSNKIRYYGSGVDDDIKIIWELHRMQWLPNVAYFATEVGDEKIVEQIIQTLKKYSDDHPVDRTIAWMEGIEVSLRSISIITTLNYLCGVIKDGDDVRKIHTILVIHAKWIEDNLSYKWKLNNNHLLIELIGLTILGLYLDWHPSSEKWVKKGIEGLKIELNKQVIKGRNWEPTTAYHRFVTEGLLVLINHLDSSCKLEDVTIFRSICQEMLEALCWMSTKSGKMPLVGDDDGGYVLTKGKWEINDNRDVLKFADEIGLKFKKNPIGIRIWNSLGFAIIKNEDTVIHCVSGAPRGLRRQGSHRHLDMLSLAIMTGEKNILYDSGTGIYFGKKEWRDYFRESRNHSGVRSGVEEWSEIKELFEIRNPPIGEIKEENKSIILICTDRNNNVQKRTVSMENNKIKIVDNLTFPKPISTFIFDHDTELTDNNGERIFSGDGFSVKQNTLGKKITIRNEFTNPKKSSPNERTSTISNGYGKFLPSLIFEIEHDEDKEIVTDISIIK